MTSDQSTRLIRDSGALGPAGVCPIAIPGSTGHASIHVGRGDLQSLDARLAAESDVGCDRGLTRGLALPDVCGWGVRRQGGTDDDGG